jgi:hypothetical protein
MKKNILKIGEKEVIFGINSVNCRYNACLLYCIITFCNLASITIDDLIKNNLDKFNHFVILIFTQSFFQDVRDKTEKFLNQFEKNMSIKPQDGNKVCVFWSSSRSEDFVVTHMLNIINIQDRFFFCRCLV